MQGAYAPTPLPRPPETKMPAQYADKPFAAQIQSAARKAAIDPALVHAVIFVESRYNPGTLAQGAIRSDAGAAGNCRALRRDQSGFRWPTSRPARVT